MEQRPVSDGTMSFIPTVSGGFTGRSLFESTPDPLDARSLRGGRLTQGSGGCGGGDQAFSPFLGDRGRGRGGGGRGWGDLPLSTGVVSDTRAAGGKHQEYEATPRLAVAQMRKSATRSPNSGTEARVARRTYG